MIQHDFSEYAALWREQIDPQELAELQSMATKIKRTAARKWLLERLATLVLAGITGAAILRWPASPLIKLCLALLLLLPVWGLWRRYQLTKAARAIAVDDPRVFFDAAIENLRAETKLLIVSAWLVIPFMIASLLLIGAALGFDRLYLNIVDILTLASPRSAAIAVVVILAHHLFRENIRRREQLRRLEAMRREWAERDPGEEP